MSEDACRILGVSPNASEEAIRAAYFREALRWHPDRHVGEGQRALDAATLRFGEVSRAYQLLSDPRRRAGGSGRREGGSQADWRASEWRSATQHSQGGWREPAGSTHTGYAWRGTDMRGEATGATEQGAFWTLRRLSRGLSGVAAGLILLFLTVKAPLGAVLPSDERSGRGSESEQHQHQHQHQHRPSPDRLSKAAAEAFGLPYRPPRLQGRGEAQQRWAASHARGAAAAADAAEADSRRAAEAAAQAAEAAQRCRAAAARAVEADSPGGVARASAEATSLADRARRARQAADYAAACAVVSAGPAEEAPDVRYGASRGGRASARESTTATDAPLL